MGTDPIYPGLGVTGVIEGILAALGYSEVVADFTETRSSCGL